MWIRLMVLSLLCLPALARADDYKVIKLEQDMRNLERQVNELKRQVDVLERRESGELLPSVRASNGPGNRSGNPSRTDGTASATATDEVPWYSRANWDRVKVGMNELDVIRLLGKPNSMRSEDADSSTLLYALEIGSGAGFLSGSVELKNHQVVAVNKPLLK
jgi:hypothetical protein